MKDSWTKCHSGALQCIGYLYEYNVVKKEIAECQLKTTCLQQGLVVAVLYCFLNQEVSTRIHERKAHAQIYIMMKPWGKYDHDLLSVITFAQDGISKCGPLHRQSDIYKYLCFNKTLFNLCEFQWDSRCCIRIIVSYVFIWVIIYTTLSLDFTTKANKLNLNINITDTVYERKCCRSNLMSGLLGCVLVLAAGAEGGADAMAEVAGEQLWSGLTWGQGQPDGHTLLVFKHLHLHLHRHLHLHQTVPSQRSEVDCCH